MIETNSQCTAFVLVHDWCDLDDWASESRCEVLTTELLASTAWRDNALCGRVCDE
jgi:hypothetical protein